MINDSLKIVSFQSMKFGIYDLCYVFFVLIYNEERYIIVIRL